MQPTYFDLEPTKGCNLRCRMCHVSFMKEPVAYLDLDRVDLSFLKGSLVALGAVFEPCIHPQINRLIDTLNKLGCRLVLITNGHNLHKKHIPALFDSDLEMVTFSFDGIAKETYELIRVGGAYERTLENIVSFRHAFASSPATFAVNFTVMRANLPEIEAAPSFWDERGFDVLRFIAMTVRERDPFLEENSLWEIREDYFAALEKAAAQVRSRNLRISITSPYFQAKGFPEGVVSGHATPRIPRLYAREHQYGADFGMSFPCKSPFVAARILWDGTVMLCHNQPAGNLYKEPFQSIWGGSKAFALRQRVKSSNALCERCDYFRFCLGSPLIDLNNVDNYFSQSMLDRGGSTASAAMRVIRQEWLPRLRSAVTRRKQA